MHSWLALGKRVLRPIPMVGNVATVGQALVVVLAIFAGGTFLGIKLGPGGGVALVAVVLLLLTAKAAFELQREQDRRDAVSFECWFWLEFVDWEMHVDGNRWKHRAVAWAWVENNGPTARFAAQIRDVEGVPESWRPGERSYFVAEAAWDGQASSVTEIPAGQRRKLKLASVLLRPRGFWFWTSERRNEVPGYQWSLGDAQAEVSFRLVVTEAASGATVALPGRISIPESGDPSLSLVSA